MTLNTRKMVYVSLLTALGIVFPMVFHLIPNAGSVFLPMHIPTLIAGIVVGPVAGLIVGISSPLLSGLLTGMPPIFMLPSMALELGCYGFFGGLLYKNIKLSSRTKTIYFALGTSMILGRIIYGIVNIFVFNMGSTNVQELLYAWVLSSFVTGFPGIVLQVVAIPLIVTALDNANLVLNKKDVKYEYIRN